MTPRRWTTSFLNGDESDSNRRALIILNQPVGIDLLKRLWKATSWHACADGGANFLFDLTRSNSDPELVVMKPDLIKGDLDSIRPEVKKHYEEINVAVVEDPDQYATDLMKCVKSVEELEQERDDKAQYEIIILGGLSGRFDQTIHVVSYMHKCRKRRKHMYVVTNDGIGWCLDEGEHIIERDPKVLGRTCGLLPIGVDFSTITTRGLVWNLENTNSSFDGLVSSSNAVAEDEKEVTVQTSKPIFWTIELSFL